MNPDSLSPRLQSLVQNTRALLEHAVREYGDVVYSNSLGAEAMVLTDIICGHAPEIGMFTLDTGRLHDETLALLDRVERRYQRRIEVFYPDAEAGRAVRARQRHQRFLPRHRGASESAATSARSSRSSAPSPAIAPG